MIIIAQIVGIAAVTTFLLSYQQKKRKNIITLNAISRVLYIIQYFLLGAYSGAVLDILGTVSSVLAQNKDKEIIKKRLLFFIIFVNVAILAAGLILCRNIYDLLPIAGVILNTIAFWITKEKIIRIVSLAAAPFWLIYNLISLAYGSAIGDILTAISIIVAIWRYDIRKEKNK